MSIAESFFNKALISFKSGKNYQALKEFNACLTRQIESTDGHSFERVEYYINGILPFLEANSLFHETEQLIIYYFTHLKKHKLMDKGFLSIFNVIKKNISSTEFDKSIMHLFFGFCDFASKSNDQNLISFVEKEIINFCTENKEFQFSDELFFKSFHLCVSIRLFTIAEDLSFPQFLNTITNRLQLTYALYSLLVLSINQKLDIALKQVQLLRKKLSAEFQKEEIFQCCSEFILASSSRDLPWFQELQEHFFGIIEKEQLLKILLISLAKAVFPAEHKVSLFDFFNK